MKRLWQILSLLLILTATGCGSFVAHRMVDAPNRFPTWLHPEPRVTLGFGPKFLTNFPSHFASVGQPKFRMFYRIIEPADFHLRVASTNWVEHGRKKYNFSFRANVPGKTNQWTGNPKGTVVLLHGYGLAQFAMAPWAVQLAEDGWRCVLVDLRGHGKSTGKKIFYGTCEADDLKQLLDALAQSGELRKPVAAFGESYGGSLALRWKAEDPRVQKAIVIAPYASLSNAVLNICHDYAAWVPQSILRAGLRHLPQTVGVPPEELDTTTVLQRHPSPALFIAAAEDTVAPVADVKALSALAAGSELIVVPTATHEAVTYFIGDLAPPIEHWLDNH